MAQRERLTVTALREQLGMISRFRMRSGATLTFSRVCRDFDQCIASVDDYIAACGREQQSGPRCPGGFRDGRCQPVPRCPGGLRDGRCPGQFDGDLDGGLYDTGFGRGRGLFDGGLDDTGFGRGRGRFEKRAEANTTSPSTAPASNVTAPLTNVTAPCSNMTANATAPQTNATAPQANNAQSTVNVSKRQWYGAGSWWNPSTYWGYGGYGAYAGDPYQQQQYAYQQALNQYQQAINQQQYAQQQYAGYPYSYSGRWWGKQQVQGNKTTGQGQGRNVTGASQRKR